MDCIVTEETFDWFADFWKDHRSDLRWNTPFVLPPWLRVWLQNFAPQASPLFFTARQGENVIGIAPMLVTNRTASFIGSTDVCDYVDFIIAPGRESIFCTALLKKLKEAGVTLLDMASVRPDSQVITFMTETARQHGCSVSCEKDDISLERDLPSSWEDYLQLLTSKHRHEIRRKLRRLEEAGSVNYHFIDSSEFVPGFMDIFLDLFSQSRDDKADFMTAGMEVFFRAMAMEMCGAGLFRGGILELDSVPVAAIITFDFNDIVYLYNSSLTEEHRALSVGVLSKVLCIRDSIERGKKRFDFLKGDEHYKYQLGGQEVQLYRCLIKL